MTAELPRLDQDVKAVNIFDKSVALNVTIGCLGATKKLGSDQIEVDADKTRISASKSILASPELEAIRAAQRAVSTTLRKLCLPSLFKSGIYLIPIASIADIDVILVEAKKTIMDALVPKFLAVYPTLVENDKISLRGTFDLADYPTLSKVQNSFYFDWSYISFGVPDALKGVDSDLFKREQEKAAQRLNDAASEIETILRAQMLDLVSHLTDRLAGTRDNGKPKIFKDSLVGNVKEFLKEFSRRNITDDAELERLCDQARGLLDGVDPQALREQEQVRDRVAQGFQQIKAQLDGMMTDRKTRLIQFEQPEE
jgi:hypothetical protein